MANETTLKDALAVLKAAMIKGGTIPKAADETEEELHLKKISFDKDELVLFRDEPAEEIDYITGEKLKRKMLSLFKSIFIDVYQVELVYIEGDKNSPINKWAVALSFKYMTDKQYNAIKDADKSLIRALDSTFDPAQYNSVSESLLALNKVQNVANSDVSKYTTISKETKELLTDLALLVPTQKKKKIEKGVNCNIFYSAAPAYNGRTYGNIYAQILLDAERVIHILAVSKDEENKYAISLSQLGKNPTGTDELYAIRRTNKKRTANLSDEIGIQFAK